jgi:hypothetical protein
VVRSFSVTKGDERRYFFSEEKKQKTFVSGRCGNMLDMAGNLGAAKRLSAAGRFVF